MALCATCNQPRSLRTGHVEPIASTATKAKEKQYSEYVYKRLPKYLGFIRVLRLLGNGIYNAEVECELLVIDFIGGKPLEYEYEALSWCWGTAKPTGRIVVRKGGRDKKRLSKSVTPDLVAALRALRYHGKDRFLWIDQVCIDQGNPLEKNHQVEMMSEIYGRATKVCIWLGEGDRSSRMALEFIKKEVLQLQNFDELCGSEQASEKWGALLDLMQRPWFSRRWVVQEIALAHSTVVYCGGDKISWKKFAVAVELFVEVETATHRLSEVMKKDPRFYHVPGWFEYVSALGASLLVEATGKLFRDYKPNGPIETEEDSDSEADSEDDDTEDEEGTSESDMARRESIAAGTRATSKTTTRSPGQPLLTLEYLVSSLSIFEVTTPHDAIYALLAIARDTTPFADDKSGFRHQLVKTQQALEGFTQKKRYIIDYQKPFADVCKDFVTFCIEGSKDRTRALDIICRPWAPDISSNEAKYERKHRRSATRHAERIRSKPKKDSGGDKINVESRRPSGDVPQLNANSTESGKSLQSQKKQYSVDPSDQDFPLPSWIPSLSGAAYAMYSQAGVHTLKMGRKNADTLVGLPPSNQSLERNYNAAETRGVDVKSLRFVKRPQLRHWSMYVKGFVLDKVVETQPSSQGGAIPRSWATAGRWVDVPESDPPDQFWRTLVADRGRDGKNPPVYYSRACKESFAKGGLSSGSVNMTDLINNERCSVIAQFCRRVQAVIWNRCMITTESDRLGLSGQDIQREDLVCILYGCSVPVALRRMQKSKDQVLQEMDDELMVTRKRILSKYQKARDDRKYRRMIENVDRALNYFWEEKLQEIWRGDLKGRKAWRDMRRQAQIKVHEKNSKYQDITMEGEPETFTIAALNDKERESLLERRAYVQWKNNKRKSKDMPEKGFKRGDKRTFGFQLRWGRRWKQIWKKNKDREIEQVAKDVGTSRGLENYESHTAPADAKSKSVMGKAEADANGTDSIDCATNTPDVNEHITKGDISNASEEKLSPSGLSAIGTAWALDNGGINGDGKSSKDSHTNSHTTVNNMTNGDDSSSATEETASASGNGTSPKVATNGLNSDDHRDDKHRDSVPDAKQEPKPDDYIRRYRDWYLAPYRTNGKETEQDNGNENQTTDVEEIKKDAPRGDDIDPEEPDWTKKDKNSLRIQEKWCYYKFLGECYVHGMMDGEAMAYQNENGIQAQVFELR